MEQGANPLKRIRYTKFTGDLSSSFGLEDLMQALSDFLLDSGYQDPYAQFDELNNQTMENLREAIRQALESGELFDEESQQKFDELAADQVDELIDNIIQKMQEQNFINAEEPKQGPGQRGDGDGEARFEVTDKSMDFLGYKALRELLGPMGRSNIGRHDTRHEAAGVETNGSSKLYEFGDTLNLDITATLSSVFAREGIRTAVEGEEHAPLNVEYSDIHVHQSDYQSSCATVVLLDCSHSMILYGEDRFTPAKRVAMALAHLIRTQFPGDTLNLVLFHDTAEEIPVSQLSRVKVGPHYTNTRDGLRLAQRILAKQNKDEADRDDHGRQTERADIAGRSHLQERFRSRSAGDRGDSGRSKPVQALEHHDQHVYAGLRFLADAVCAEGERHVSREGLLYDAADAGQLPTDGLHVAPDEDGPLRSFVRRSTLRLKRAALDASLEDRELHQDLMPTSSFAVVTAWPVWRWVWSAQ
jgi:Ca-activated chloride channel family protein